MRIILAITGASGVAYGLSLAKELKGHELHVIISESAKEIIAEEIGDAQKAVSPQLGHAKLHPNDSFSSPVASGSFLFDAMVVSPCSMKTLSAIANGYSSNLICRAADVALKEHRKLIIVPRETPLSAIHLENMLKLARLGAVILPASPGFYSKPKTTQDMVDFITGKTLDSLGVPNKLFKRWKG